MAHGAHDEPQLHMGLPLPNGKLAIWLFLVTEIMFFTALIGTYLILRNGTPTVSPFHWPTPKQVHLVEWIGAFNTFVLICSSLTVVLAHFEGARRNFQKATVYVLVTLLLGGVFLLVKAYEYNAKFQHDILPGRMGELESAEGLTIEREKLFHANGMDYVNRVRAQLQAITGSEGEESTEPGIPECSALLTDMAEGKDKDGAYKSPLTPAQVGSRVNGLLNGYPDLGLTLPSNADDVSRLTTEVQEVADDPKLHGAAASASCHVLLQTIGKLDPSSAEDFAKIMESTNHLMHGNHELHLTPAIPFGNLWASCYFAMTGFHALHVLGGLVVFVIILVLGVKNLHPDVLELTGLYWHFVDIVWIFLFPLLYLV